MSIGISGPAQRRAKKLQALRVSEISSVDRGANPGAQVVLMKRYSEDHMQTPSINEAIQKSMSLRDAGEIDDTASALLMKHFARARFPKSRSESEALHKWLSTLEGAEFMRRSLERNAFEIQKRSSCGDAYDFLKAGMDDIARSSPPAADDIGDNYGFSGFEDHNDWKTACDRMRKLIGGSESWAQDAVHTYRHRKEQAAKFRGGLPSA